MLKNQFIHKEYPDISVLTKHIEHMLETADYSIYWKDKKGSYIGANKYFLGLNDLTNIEDVIGKSDFDLDWNEQAPIFSINDQNVVSTGIARTYMEPSKVGQDLKWFLSHKQPLFSRDGNIIGVYGQSILIHDGKTDVNLPFQIEKCAGSSNILNEPFCSVIENIKDKLSGRQKQCLYYIFFGMTAKQIGKILNISYRTVEIHIAELKKKLKCSSREDLVKVAMKMDFFKNMFLPKEL